MHKVNSEITIRAPKKEVWNVLADFGNIHRWNPHLNNSHLLSDLTCGLNTTRQCNLANGGVLKERITQWNEGESLEVDVYDSNLPIAKSSVKFELEQGGAGKTRVIITSSFQFKFGLLGRLMGTLVGKRMFQSSMDGLLLGLKHHVETGELVTPKSFPQLRAK